MGVGGGGGGLVQDTCFLVDDPKSCGAGSLAALFCLLLFI